MSPEKELTFDEVMQLLFKEWAQAEACFVATDDSDSLKNATGLKLAIDLLSRAQRKDLMSREEAISNAVREAYEFCGSQQRVVWIERISIFCREEDVDEIVNYYKD
jgi:hypothetical protein